MSDGQIARLKAALRERDARLADLEARMSTLERSVTWQVGRVVTGAARRPSRVVYRLPRDLYRLWRRRGGPLTEAEGGRPDLPVPVYGERDEVRLVSGAARDATLVVAGILGSDAAAALRGHARIVPLLPHDASFLLDRVEADLLIVDAAAGEPGGPWAYLGVPGVADRERTLITLMAVARQRGVPVVLWGSAPGLRGLRWDATGDPGVSLRRFNPVGRTPEPVTATTIAQVRQHLARGDEVTCPPALTRRLDENRLPYVNREGPDRVLSVGGGGAGINRAALRVLFADHATPVRLAELTSRLGIDADPLADRTVAVRAAEITPRMTAGIEAQTHRPVEVIEGDGTADAAWVAPWPDHDVPATYLADLVCAAECAGADAVGLADAPDYTFVGEIDPALLRPGLHEIPRQQWAAGGARLLALSA